MPCLVVFIALAAPRLVILLLWFFSTWFVGIFASLLVPILGFIFLPTALLWYSAVVNWFAGHWTPLNIAGMVVAVLIDLSPTLRRRR